MNRKSLRNAVALLALLALPAAAGPLEDGMAAYDKGDYKTAAQNFMVAASQGDDNARARLGIMFAYGVGVPQDAAQAIFWLSLAAEHNNPEADTAMGVLAMEGRFVKQNLDEALSFFQRAAVQGNRAAQNYLGQVYMKGTPKVKADYAAAFNSFSQAARQNEPEAQYYLGFFYYTGQFGVRQDYQASLDWFTKAAEQGNTAAQTFLGTQYDKGLGTAQDAARAITYFQMAAAQGNLQGLALLGEHYITGSGVTADNQRAYVLLNLAGGQVQGPLQASTIKARDTAAAKLTQTQIQEAQKVSAFCGTNKFFILCLDERTPVSVAAADPQAAATKLANAIKAQQQQAGQPPDSAGDGARTAANAPSDGKPKLEATGTGFFINNAGDIVTANHVIKGCGEVRAQGMKLKVIATDDTSDIAVLASGSKPAAFVKLRGGRGPRVGEALVAVGFPLHGYLGEDLVVTTGIVSSLAGGGNDRRFLQVSAPLQPGNSGGPNLGEDGAVVGISDSVTSTLEMAKELGGVVTQNVNFAVSVGTLQSLLNARQVPYTLSDGAGPAKSSAQIASEAQRYTMLLECWN